MHSLLLINVRYVWDIARFVCLRVSLNSQGENPFNGNQDDQDPEDSMVMDVSEGDLTNESLNEVKQEEEGPQAEGAEPVAEAAANGAGHDEEMKMDMGGATEEEGVEAGEGDEEGVEGVEVGEEEAELLVSADTGAIEDADANAANADAAAAAPVPVE